VSFNYKGWQLGEALDALFAYDMGATDSGVHDDEMKDAIAEYMDSLTDRARSDLLCDHLIEHFVGPEARASGYGIEDAWHFLRWLQDDMGCM